MTINRDLVIEKLVGKGVSNYDIVNGGLDGTISLAKAGNLSIDDAVSISSVAIKVFK